MDRYNALKRIAVYNPDIYDIFADPQETQELQIPNKDG